MNIQDKKFKSGRGYQTYQEPTKEILDLISIKKIWGRIQFKSEEFTSLCPITDQPDWASVQITFTPKEFTLETKSLKLYLHAFRNYKGFAEDINQKIVEDIWDIIQPSIIEVSMLWKKRGGIEIFTTFAKGGPNEP